MPDSYTYVGEHSRVTFRVKCEAALGQVVGITGDASGFGVSRQNSVITLVTTPEDYPIWSTPTPIVVPTHQSLSYKYCLVEGGSFRSFEHIEGCRTICPKELDLLVEETVILPQSVNATLSENDLSAAFEKLESKAPNIETASSFKRLFIVSNHLPVVIKRLDSEIDAQLQFEVSWAESMLAKTENSMADSVETYWVGTVPSIDHASLTPVEKDALTAKLGELHCLPIYLDKVMAQGHYNGFCKQVMWPLFHNVDQLDSIYAEWKVTPKQPVEKQKPRILSSSSGSPTTSPQVLVPPASGSSSPSNVGGTPPLVTEEVKWNSEFFDVYAEVNRIFTEKVASFMQPDDILWIHDYHLMLMPKMLRESPQFSAIAENSAAGGAADAAGVSASAPRIIFFLHIPFPTSQIFRTLSHADELLTSLTCADVIGFHAFDYTRHFLHATSRILGVTSRSRPGGLLSLLVGDREVIVTMNHLAIEPVLLKQTLLIPQTRIIAEHYAAKYAGKKIVVGVDSCQRLSGLGVKFDAFERFLMEDPRAGRGVVLIQKAIRNGSRKDDEAHTSSELQQMVSTINNRFYKRAQSSSLLLPPSGAGSSRTGSPTTKMQPGGSPAQLAIDYEEVPALSLVHRVALWLVADVFLSTALREGLNLTPMEYIYCRRHVPHAGCVITSDFALTASLLSGALKVNPYNVNSIVDALQVAIFMKDKDANSRRLRDLKFITSRNSSSWVRRILSDLRQLNDDDIRHRMQALPGDVMQLRFRPRLLRNEAVASSFAHASPPAQQPSRGSRVFLFDYGGTLLKKEKFDIYVKQTLSDLSASQPSDEIMSSLRTLSEDPNNVVIVCSGLGEEVLSRTFQDIPNLVLFARHGMVFSWGAALGGLMSAYDTDEPDSMKVLRTKSCGDREWVVRDFGVDWEVIQQIAVPILKKFEEVVNGTMAAVSPPHLGWNYFSADPEWGYKQAAQLIIELEAGLAMHDVQVWSNVKGTVEILPKSLDKTTMPRLVFERILRGDVDADVERSRTVSDENSPWTSAPGDGGFAGRFPSFVLAVGDDPSDDIVFGVCPRYVDLSRIYMLCVALTYRYVRSYTAVFVGTIFVYCTYVGSV